LVGTSVQVPFKALWSRAEAENAQRKVVKITVIVVCEYVLMNSFQELPFSTNRMYFVIVAARAQPFR
jgi:hypothetical protein